MPNLASYDRNLLEQILSPSPRARRACLHALVSDGVAQIDERATTAAVMTEGGKLLVTWRL
jgi:hypothetical protein